MKEYEIEVLHVPSGQYFTISEYFDEEEIVDEDALIEHIANDLTIIVRKDI